MDDDRVIALLESIDRRLALLTAPQERDMRKRLEEDLLRTDARTKMFDSINGERTSQEIAKAAQVSDRAVQLFVKELLDASLARETGGGQGRSIVVKLDAHAIVQWYAKQLIER